MSSVSPLCQLNNGCMGCCGHSFPSLSLIKEAIQLNTQEFFSCHPQTEQHLLQFRDRTFSMDLRNGVCRNLITKGGHLFCPLHPQQNQGRDLRQGHCDIDHLCRTAKEFSRWEPPKQRSFLQFLKNKNLDNLSYSLLMDNSSLLNEFKSNII